MTELTDTEGRPLPVTEAPDADTLRAYGDAAFLMMRSPRHAGMTLAAMRAALEPPLVLGQYRIFRFDGVPRALITWAWMSEDAERTYVAGGALTPEDWRSGERLWLIDLIAPYRGLAASVTRWVMVPGNFARNEFRFRRVEGGNRTRRIVHIRLDRPDDKATILTEADFG